MPGPPAVGHRAHDLLAHRIPPPVPRYEHHARNYLALLDLGAAICCYKRFLKLTMQDTMLESNQFSPCLVSYDTVRDDPFLLLEPFHGRFSLRAECPIDTEGRRPSQVI